MTGLSDGLTITLICAPVKCRLRLRSAGVHITRSPTQFGHRTIILCGGPLFIFLPVTAHSHERVKPYGIMVLMSCAEPR